VEIVRYHDRVDGDVHIGVTDGAGVTGDGGSTGDAGVTPVAVADLADLWSRPAADLPGILASPAGPRRPAGEVVLLAPVDGRTEVWAAGVTYARSRAAREEESTVAGLYDRVYEADRPELFFKSVAWRVVTDGQPVAIREDSELNVPEAELALVVNAGGEIVGYGVCNDMSSRSIEGDNPLYLPQAKIYAGSCALAPGIRPAWEVPDPGRLGIEVTVTRQGAPAWAARTTTAAMVRTPGDLVAWLFAGQSFPAGVILSTGTGLVPEMDFTLRPGDVVRIVIDGVGTLTNPVRAGKETSPEAPTSP
jgi:2-dehydro-3-deoxy-D-arabinonate dehydratase